MANSTGLSKTIAAVRAATSVFFLLFGEYKLVGSEFAHGGFQAYLQDYITSSAAGFYRPVLSSFVLPHAVFLGYVVGLVELLVGISLLIGIWVRPACIVGILFLVNMLLATGWAPGHGVPFWRYFGNELDHLPLLLLLIIFYAADSTPLMQDVFGDSMGARAISGSYRGTTILTENNSKMTKTCGILAVLLLSGLAVGQARLVAVHAGHVLDVKSGKTLHDQTIMIEDGKITSIGAATELKVPSAALRVELPNATVLPGLIDAHTHLTMDPKFGYERLAISVSREALIGAKNARATLLAGFTSVRNVGASEFSDVALRDAINAGDVPGPRMLVSGPALGITGGHCDNNMLPFEYHATEDGVADGVAAVQHKVRENIKYGSDLIKVCATGGVLSLGDNPQHSQYTLEEMKAIVADAHRLGRKVAAHAHGAEGIRWAVEAGVDSIEHGSYIDDAAIAVMKEHGTYLVPTLYLGDWMMENAAQIHMPPPLMAKAKEVLPAARKNVAHAFASGIKVALGTDAAVYPHGLNGHEFAVMVKLGLTPLQSIQAGTINAADLLGWSGKVGTLEPGAWGDIVAVDGDPLKDVTVLERVKFVMKDGEVVKNEYAK